MISKKSESIDRSWTSSMMMCVMSARLLRRLLDPTRLGSVCLDADRLRDDCKLITPRHLTLEILADLQDLAQDDQQEVRVDRSLVDFVDDDVPATVE
jgi:transposase